MNSTNIDLIIESTLGGLLIIFLIIIFILTIIIFILCKKLKINYNKCYPVLEFDF